MARPQITEADLTPQWRDEVHTFVATTSVDPLVERAGARVSEYYRKIVEKERTQRLARQKVAHVVNGLNGRNDLSDAERWLVGLPYVLVRALERAVSAKVSRLDELTDAVLAFVRDDVLRVFTDEYIDESTAGTAVPSEVRGLGLQGGDIDRDVVREQLLGQPIEVRAGLAVPAVVAALTRARSTAKNASGPTSPSRENQKGPTAMTSNPPATPTTGTTAAGTGTPAAPASGTSTAASTGTAAVPAGGTPPPLGRYRIGQFQDLDCGYDVPEDDAGGPTSTAALAPARAIAYLYTFSERQPAFDAVLALRERAFTSEFLMPDQRERMAAAFGDDDPCDLWLTLAGWNQEGVPLTLEMCASAAAVIGIPDAASTTPVNTRFAQAMDQVLDLLVAYATDCCEDTVEWVEPALRIAAIRVLEALRGAMTGRTLLTVSLWRRQYESARSVLTRRITRELLGVHLDPDDGPAAAIRRLVPSAVFDPAALAEEWRALRRILDLVGRLVDPATLPPQDLREAARAAVALRVLSGRLTVPSSGRAAEGGSAVSAAANRAGGAG